MKKLAAILLAGLITMGTTACADQKENTKAEETKTEIADATELLAKVWEAVPEESRFYVVGGENDNFVEDQPGAMNLEKAEELGMENRMCYPMSAIEYIDDASSLIHGMISNGFTAGAYHVTEAANVETVAEQIKERTLSNQWMCGFPEKLVITSVEDYVVSFFGYTENIENFKEAMMEVYGDAVEVLVDQPIE